MMSSDDERLFKSSSDDENDEIQSKEEIQNETINKEGKIKIQIQEENDID